MSDELNKHSRMTCTRHGARLPSFLCGHLEHGRHLGFNQPNVPFDPEWPFKNAWCDACDEVFSEEGEWNERSESFAEILMLCEGCFDESRRRNQLRGVLR